MEAANRGAFDVGAPSIGFNITLPEEQKPNSYITPELNFCFHYFAMRKMHLAMRANALAIFPGGFGTMDELFEALTLIQTGKIDHFPIVVMGTDYWREMTDFLGKMARLGTISPQDLELVYPTDSVEQAIAHIREQAIKPFGLRPKVRRHVRWLGECGLQNGNPFHYAASKPLG
jgi:hypothetical protein